MRSIPWRLDTSSSFSLWVWETEHFRCTVQTDQHRVTFSWDITDHSQGKPSHLADGLCGSLRDAEDKIRGTIGKSYPPTLGYQQYAGRFATTFTIFTGEEIDFGPLRATKVILQVRVVENGSIRIKRYIGRLDIDHYNIRIVPEHGNATVIPPSRITSVQREFGGPVKPVEREDVLANALRIYPGTVKPGCTGKPGFISNTVEHPSKVRRCPVHEL